MSKIYDVQLTNNNSNNFFLDNFKLGLENCQTKSEKIRLLTLLPQNQLSKIEIILKLSITIYMVDESRKLTKNKGIYFSPDPYNGHPISEKQIKLVHEYYLNDD